MLPIITAKSAAVLVYQTLTELERHVSGAAETGNSYAANMQERVARMVVSLVPK